MINPEPLPDSPAPLPSHYAGALPLQWADKELWLLPERALWWPEMKTVFIADTHFGKAATFRLAGIPVSECSHLADLDRLTLLLNRTRADQLIILGDFFHARQGHNETTIKALADWRQQCSTLNIHLIAGNHDRHAGRPSSLLNMEYHEEPWIYGPFICCHEPERVEGYAVLAGHIHPTYRLAVGGDGISAPCFHVSDQVMILPAFGSFTGGARVRPSGDERVYLVGPDQVIAVPNKASRR